ncbi:MAG TPA: polysaccharide biosynthesis/export family protein [Chthoniobacterales bacterium]
MTTRSDFAAASSSKRTRPLSLSRAAAVCASVLALLSAPASLRAQSPTAAPESAARNFLAPSPPTTTGPSVTTNAVTAPSGYVLSANDQVAVEVFGEDDLRTNGRLNAEGNLSLPLLGSVHLSGLTLTQATARVTELYARDYLVNPKVNVMLVSYAKRRFTVLGQVNRPGSFEMPDGSPTGIDLLEAVAMAGGYTRIAAPERITVRRHGPNGDEMVKVDGKRLARGSGGANTNFKVLPGDTITVGESIF